jgi:hypothetical protein
MYWPEYIDMKNVGTITIPLINSQSIKKELFRCKYSKPEIQDLYAKNYKH